MLTLEAHLVTKFAALLDRAHTEKGSKDAREIDALLGAKPEMSRAIDILLAASQCSAGEIRNLLAEVFEVFPERARVNKLRRRELRMVRIQWLDEIERRLARLGSPANPIDSSEK